MLRISLDTTVYYIAHLNPNTNSRRVVKKAIEANFGPPCNSRVHALFHPSGGSGYDKED